MNNIKISTINNESEIDILKDKTSIYWDFVIKYDKSANDTINLLKTNFKDKDNLYLIAKEDNEFVWFCSIDKQWWEEWFYYIREIFIEPRYQKQKIWKELVQRCINYAKEKWAIWVITQTAFENIPMQKFCEKFWFKKWNNPKWKDGITYKLIFIKNNSNKSKNDIYVDPNHEEHSFDLPFWRDNNKLWTLDVPTEEMDINDLKWILDIPFWEDEDWNIVITPNEVISNLDEYVYHRDKIYNCDASYPIDIMKNKKWKWLTLDGLHRLVKMILKNETKIKVRKIPPEIIHLTAKDD